MKSKLWVFREFDPFHRGRFGAGPLNFLCDRLIAPGPWCDDACTKRLPGCRTQVAHDPFLIPDMEQAVERLHQAVSRSGADLFLRRL